MFDVEFLVTAEHPRFQTPAPDAWGCFLRGRLRFPRVTRLTGLRARDDVPMSVDATGERDFGNFDDLAQGPDGYMIVGDFGRVLVSSDGPLVELDPTAA